MIKVFLFLFFMTFADLTEAQQKANGHSRSVEQTVIKLFEALSNRDSVNLKDYCAADVLFFEYGQVWNLDSLIQKAITRNQSADFKRVNKIDFIQTVVNNDIAWTTYNNEAAITSNGTLRKVKWVETVILEKKKEKWKIKVLHSTPAR